MHELRSILAVNHFQNYSLYCTYFVLGVYNLRLKNHFFLLLKLLLDAFPKGVSLPKNTFEVKKIVKLFDLGYTKINAFLYDCMSFWRDKVYIDICNMCGPSIWATNKKGMLERERKLILSHPR